jgi:hypothetical protein
MNSEITEIELKNQICEIGMRLWERGFVASTNRFCLLLDRNA